MNAGANESDPPPFLSTGDLSEETTGEDGDETTPSPLTLQDTVRSAGTEPLVLPDYDVHGVLGRGAIGVVYEALHRKLKRPVALKVLTTRLDERSRSRFGVEAESIASLHHPHIVQVYDLGEHQGRPFLALELVRGRSLDKVVTDEPPNPRQAAELLEKLARAMDYAHGRGIVHRDLKPSNILVDDEGQPRITDFGLAKQLAAAGETMDGEVMGTPNYMAPEQASGRVELVGPAADVHALGAILFELLSGDPPFAADTVIETLDNVRYVEAPRVRTRNPRVHRDLETICEKCLRKDPRDRYESAAALADDLRRFVDGESILARPVGVTERILRFVRRHPVAIAAVLITVSVITIGGSYLVSAWRTSAIEKGIADAERRQRELLAPVEIASPLGLPVVPVPADNALVAGKVALGQRLFFDPRLSSDGNVSCATCHDPEHGWSDRRRVSPGIAGRVGTRNSPTVVNAAQHRELFWDGRAKRLEEQTLGPLLNPDEMGNESIDELERRIEAVEEYRNAFDELFDDGITGWNIARSIAAYERTLVAGDSPNDRFEAGDETALSDAAKRGRALFFGDARCSACHVGPNLTDRGYHNLGVGFRSESETDDPGRVLHGRQLDGDHGAFRTPSLRDVARTAPYMHDGSLPTLEAVVEFYARGGTPNDWQDEELDPLGLTDAQKADLVTFLREGLTSDVYPEPPR